MNKLLPALAASFALGGIASAGIRADAPGALVRYGDLNLDSRDGAVKLYARLRRAAHDVCVSLDRRVLGLRGQYESCVADAIARGARDVGNENLTRLISERG